MLTINDIRARLEGVFDETQSQVLAEIIQDAFSQMVKTNDFNELKAVVKELAEAQQLTERRMEELAQAQRHTEQRMEDLLQALQQTDLAMETLLKGLAQTRTELSGLALSQRYSLENEAQRALPGLLSERHSITTEQKLIRAEIGGQAIDIFGRATRQGQPVLLVGEVRLGLEESNPEVVHAVFASLDDKVQAARREYQNAEIVPVLVTHFARGSLLRQATERGVIVVQSFEW